ncbi:MAG: hypothetical protein U5K56_00800 [Halioglobus sp.]|nr:hypothetical protein [Halioglobus sp.]
MPAVCWITRRLDRIRAADVADYLMTLQARDALHQGRGRTNRATSPWRLAQMNFAKFNNCIACHQDEPGYGGASGPELYTAWERLAAGVHRFLYRLSRWPGTTITLMPAQDSTTSAVSEAVRRSESHGGGGVHGRLVREPCFRGRGGGGHSWAGGRRRPRAKSSTQSYRTQCHGMNGDGGGINVRRYVGPAPDHTDPVEMGARTDEELVKAIKHGGKAVDKVRADARLGQEPQRRAGGRPGGLSAHGCAAKNEGDSHDINETLADPGGGPGADRPGPPPSCVSSR